LGRVELLSKLEQEYGVVLDEAAVAQVKTAEDVRKLMAHPHAVSEEPKVQIRHVYPHWPWMPIMQAIRSAFLEIAAMPLVRFLAKPTIEDRVREWPRGPVLMLSNHVTSYDVPLMLYALRGPVRRHVAVAMSGEMILDFRRGRNQGNWFLNLLAPIAYILFTGLFNVFPLPQMSGFRRSFRHAGEAIDRGYSVIVFPEGRRSDDGTAQPFKAGVGLLWRELGVPALPFRLEGLGEMKAHGKRWFRSGRLRVSVGDVIALDRTKTTEELTEILRQSVFGQERTLG
jgi:long-chain acyl-CoA synthetase